MTERFRSVPAKKTWRFWLPVIWWSVAIACSIATSSKSLAQQPQAGVDAASSPPRDPSAELDEMARGMPTPIEPENLPPGGDYRRWTTDWEFEDIDVGQLVDRLESIGLDLPIEVDGTVTVAFEVGVPITAPRTLEAYRIRGVIRSPSFVIGSLRLDGYQTRVDLSGGVLSLSQVQAKVSGDADTETSMADSVNRIGAVRGIASMDLRSDHRDDDTSLRLNAAVDRIALGPVLRAIDEITSALDIGFQIPNADGVVSGKLLYAGPATEPSSLRRITVAARGQASEVTLAGGNPLAIETGPITIDRQRLSAADVVVRDVTDPSIMLRTAVEANLAPGGTYEVAVRGNDVPAEWPTGILASVGEVSGDPTPDQEEAEGVADAVQIVSGKADIDLKLRGQIAPNDESRGTFNVDGRVSSPNLKVLGQSLGLIEHRVTLDNESVLWEPLQPDASSATSRDIVLRRVSADYQSEDDVLRIRDLDAEIFDGSIQGEIEFQKDAVSADHRVQLQWQNIAPEIDRDLVRNLAGRIPLITTGNGPLRRGEIVLETSGAIDWSVPADAVDRPASHRGTATIDLQRIRVGEASIASGTIEATADDGRLSLEGSGDLLGGTFEVQTSAATTAASDWAEAFGRLASGVFEAKRLDVGEVFPLIRSGDRRRYRGEVSMTVDNRAADQTAVDVSLRNVAVDGQTVARDFSARVVNRDARWTIVRSAGRVAGGTVLLSGVWSMGQGPRQLEARVVSVGASPVLRVINDVSGDAFDGEVSGRLTIANGRSLRIGGSLTSRQSELFGIPVGRLYSPVQIRLASDLSSWNVGFPEIRGEAYRGQTRGELELSGRSGMVGFDMDGDFFARRVDFGEMLQEVGAANSVAHGRMTGTVEVAGRRIRGLKDIRGRFEALLGDATGEAVPGLSEASRFFAGVNFSGRSFEGGRVAGVIGGGNARVEEFVLRSPQIIVTASGRVGLPAGRMDMEATISTGNFTSTATPAAALLSRTAIDSILPGATLVELARFLSNRTVMVQLTGPFSDPTVRLRPLETAQAALQRLLIEQLLPNVTGGIIDGET